MYEVMCGADVLVLPIMIVIHSFPVNTDTICPTSHSNG